MTGKIIVQHSPGNKERTKYKVHKNISHPVKNRTCRSDPHHKAAHTGRIPFAGYRNKLFVHIIPWNCSTGKVIDQIQKDQLQALHRQKRKQCRCRQYGKHVSKVRACRHLDVLDHICICLASFNNSFFQNHQIFFQQHNICGFFRHIYCCINRNSNVCGFHCRSIVNTISHKADCMAIFTKYRHHSRFLIRCQLCKNICSFCCFCQFLITHVLQIGTKQHISYLKPYLLTDCTSDFIVVPGQNLRCHTMGF